MINFENLKEMINEEPSTWAVGHIIKIVRNFSLTICRRMLREADLNKLKQKIRDEINIWGVSFCLGELAKVDYSIWKKLIKKIDLHSLAKKIENANATEINKLLEVIALQETVGKQLINNMDVDKIALRIDAGPDVLPLINLLENFMELNEDFARKLLKKIDKEKLASKINQEPKNLRKYILKVLSGRSGTEKLTSKIES
ncbi:MAG: hypothetical protein GWN31_12040 [Candidatus Thorarchaeota archaeon]|nr:hypothetical protein [Candidatus Thorarchaeota archaeon]NIW52708.1 hypothetical protein [Candidatus Korarchaeota archaeon]